MCGHFPLPGWFLLGRVVSVAASERVLRGWPAVPGWWRGSGASPSRARAASHSPCTCAQTGRGQLFYLCWRGKIKARKALRYFVILPSGDVYVMQETPAWTTSWEPSLNWTHTSPLVSWCRETAAGHKDESSAAARTFERRVLT